MKQLNLEFELFAYVHSNSVERSPRLMKIQYYPPQEIKDRLLAVHENITKPILKHFGPGYFLSINSGYRCKEYNDTLPGASKTSDHVLGYAIDIELFKNGKNYNRELFEFCKTLKYKQLINEKNFSWIHISYDPNNLKQQILSL